MGDHARRVYQEFLYSLSRLHVVFYNCMQALADSLTTLSWIRAVFGLQHKIANDVHIV